jgi:SM-20-related protein
LKPSDFQDLFRRDLGFLYRSKMASSVHDEFDKVCLLPEDCRDERAATLLGEPQLEELRRRRVVMIDWALKPKEVLAARSEADVLDKAGVLKPIPTFSGYQARNDRATWISGDGDHALARAVRLLQGCAAAVQEGGGFEPVIVPPRVMLALYPGGGARYTKHRDSLGDDPRRVTIILYLQTLAWRSSADGGELSVQSPVENNPQRIEPKGGRMVIFDSREVEHEVLPSRGMRMALTLWLRKASADKPADGGGDNGIGKVD